MTAAPDIPAARAQAILTIDLAALAANWRLLATKVAPAECAAVIKADAYGIGLEPAARALAASGCKTFFVAHASEGVRARAALAPRQDCRVYVLNGILPGDDFLSAYIDANLRPVLGSMSEIEAWAKAAAGSAAQIPVALHVDTGMNRLGLSLTEAKIVAERARRGEIGFPIDLLMSHFVSSEVVADHLNEAQIARFDIARALFSTTRASFANSSAIFLPSHPLYDLARPGYALYGGNPTPGQANPMRAVVGLRAPIIQLREIEAGETVGYNAQWIAKRPTRLATIGVGYADGLPRNLMATDERVGGEAIVAGQRCSFAGRVSMDLTIVDVTDVPPAEVAPGRMVELLGEAITVDDMGARAGTIGYEVLTGLGRRYSRVYVGGEFTPSARMI